MKIVALCPTYRRISVMQNSVALWLQQDYDPESRFMVIADDGGTFHTQGGDGWHLQAYADRLPSMPAKYHELVRLAMPPITPWVPDAYLVWDDDDLYLPGYVTAHVNCLMEHELSRPLLNMSHYGGKVEQERRAFHAANAFRRDLGERVNYWPESKRCDFDQLFDNTIGDEARSIGRPWDRFEDCQFVMGFTDMDVPHASCTKDGPDWYDRFAADAKPEQYVGKLVPKLDHRWKFVANHLRIA